MSYRVCLIGLLMVLLGPAPSFSALKMLVTPNGDGAFFLVGDNFSGVTAADIRIDYDSTSLANPQVAAEGGTLTYVYAGTPGTLLVSVSRENLDAAFDLDLKFEKTGTSPGTIKQVTVTIKDGEGKSAPLPDATIIPLSPSPDTALGSESVTAASAGEATETRQDGGVYQVRPDGAQDRDAGTDVATSQTEAEQSGAAMETIVSVPLLRSAKSVLRRFEEFKGKKGLKELTALFKRPELEEISQEPAIALSDGKTPVRIKLNFQIEKLLEPDIALTDATLVSLRKTEGKNWVITALPSNGTAKMSVSLRSDKKMLEFPLVIAPPIKLPNGINEKKFPVALKKYVAGQAAGHKGENGSFRQYFHEYVFTANYLANQANAPRSR